MSDVEDQILEEAGVHEGGEEEEFGEEEADDSSRAVASSMVAAWGYDRQNQMIQVAFNNGNEQEYDCSPSQWDEAKNAPSPGKFVHENFL